MGKLRFFLDAITAVGIISATERKSFAVKGGIITNRVFRRWTITGKSNHLLKRLEYESFKGTKTRQWNLRTLSYALWGFGEALQTMRRCERWKECIVTK